MPGILSLDSSTTKFGYAIGDSAKALPHIGVWPLPGADDQVFDRTLGNACESIQRIIEVARPTKAVIEAPFIPMGVGDAARSAHTSAVLMQLVGAVRATLHKANIPVIMPARSTVLKFFVGNGRPKDAKEAVLAQCARLGLTPQDDNAGDAAAGWYFGRFHFFKIPLPVSATPLFARSA